jgi:glutaredoxin
MAQAVVVYGSSCPACTQARAVLDRFGIDYETRPLAELPRRYGRVRSMPQITIGDELLGGVNPLLKLARSGGLDHLAADGPRPWVRVRRRIGRGFDVELLDPLGRPLAARRAATRAEADQAAAALMAGRLHTDPPG